jgi:hypothetical protein
MHHQETGISKVAAQQFSADTTTVLLPELLFKY